MQRHLELLRGEYIELERRHADLQRRHDALLASSSSRDHEDTGGFVQRLLDTVVQLYNADLYR